MPFSTGSSDSGYHGPPCDDLSSPTLTATDEDEPRSCAPRRFAPRDRTKPARGGKPRRSRRNRGKCATRTAATCSSSSCTSEANSINGEEERKRTMSVDEVVGQVYVYFQTLLLVIRRQRKFFKQLGGVLGDSDTRWGAHGHRNGWASDPSGCLAPRGFGDPSKPVAFPGCWAVPHPAVYLALLATNVQDYLNFLRRLHPNLSTRPNVGSTRSDEQDNNTGNGTQQKTANGRVCPPPSSSSSDMVGSVPEEMMPVLMRIVQQTGGHQAMSEQQQKTQEQGSWNCGGVYHHPQPYQHVTGSSHFNGGSSGGYHNNHHNNYTTTTTTTSEGQKQYLNYSAAVARSSSSSSHSIRAVPTEIRPTEKGPKGSIGYAAKVAGGIREQAAKRDQGPKTTGTVLLPLACDRDRDASHRAATLPNLATPTSNLAPPTTPTADMLKTEGQLSTGDIGESGYQSETSPPQAVVSQRPAQRELNNKGKKEDGNEVASSPSAVVPHVTNEEKSIEDGQSIDNSSIKAPTSACPPASPCPAVTKPCPPPSSPLNEKGHFEVSKMDVLSEEIWHYHNSVTQTESMLNRKLHLRDMLYYSICPVFPMCGLYVVGSSLNGFGNNSSDMDLCLMITNKDLDQKTDAVVVLNMIISALSQLDWVANQKLILAKVPILRVNFKAPFSDITVDLNANNSVAIKNTHLLCYYSSFDWRVRPLVSVVKEWAKRKGINDAKGSSFTSYSLVLMVIHYLQCGASPAVLPCLQQLYPKRFAAKCDVRQLNVTMPLQPPSTQQWEYSEKATLGELLIGFLDYYANKFDYDRDAISVRQGKRVERAVIARNRPSNGQGSQGGGASWRSQWRCICIEEPFTLSNTAHSIYDEMVFGAIKTAFGEAHVELERSRDLRRLLACQPITVHATGAGAVVFAYEGSGSRAASRGGIASPSVARGGIRSPCAVDSPPMTSSCGNVLEEVQSTTGSGSSDGGSTTGGEDTEELLEQDRLPDLSVFSASRSADRRVPQSTSGRPRSDRRRTAPRTASRV